MRRAFTVLEAVIALAVLSTLVYLASASYLNLAPKYRLERAAWEVRSALNSARYRALFEGVFWRIKLNPGDYSYERYDEARKEWRIAERHLLEGVSLQANNTPVFTADGSVSGLATIYVVNAWGKYKITLAITGRIKTTRVA